MRLFACLCTSSPWTACAMALTENDSQWEKLESAGADLLLSLAAHSPERSKPPITPSPLLEQTAAASKDSTTQRAMKVSLSNTLYPSPIKLEDMSRSHNDDIDPSVFHGWQWSSPARAASITSSKPSTFPEDEEPRKKRRITDESEDGQRLISPSSSNEKPEAPEPAWTPHPPPAAAYPPYPYPVYHHYPYPYPPPGYPVPYPAMHPMYPPPPMMAQAPPPEPLATPKSVPRHKDGMRCIQLEDPPANKFWGQPLTQIPLPEFGQLVNYPEHLAKARSDKVPYKICVMCGERRGCHAGSRVSGDDRIIPRQNKGVCTACDVAVWVLGNGVEIKWCKGCKNFKSWSAFGDKGSATKCARCRERQREKYASTKRKT